MKPAALFLRHTLFLSRAFILLGFALLAAISQASAATVINVPGDYSTIQAALTAAATGDTVLVAPGDYPENLSIIGAVTLRSSGGAKLTKLIPTSGTVVTLNTGGVLEGFTVRTGDYSVAVTPNDGVVRNNIFEGNSGAAITGNSRSPTIEGNIFSNSGCANSIIGGVVGFVNGSNPIIRNNLFLNNTCEAINFTVPSSANPSVINNTFVGNTTAIFVDTRISTINQKYRNNIIVGNGKGLETRYGSDVDNPTWQNNLVWGNTNNYYYLSDQTGINSNISADPLFIDAANGDYRLQHASPAVDVGSSIGAPGVDFYGNLRPYDGDFNAGAGYDIGYFEVYADIDGDGITVYTDNCLYIANSDQSDGDSDGHGDACDALPDNAAEWQDSDGDGIGNNSDNCPTSNSDQLDADGDGHGDTCDALPNNAAEWQDSDGDGIGNNSDNCPTSNSDQLDADGDGQGDACDSDDDNDSVPDASDALPLNAFESVDTDRDGIGNNADTDDDGDGVPDASDAFPLNAEAAVDTDQDGMPDAMLGGIGSAEGFEGGSFAGRPWVMGGNASWTITNSIHHAGAYSAQSGVIGHSSSSSLEITQVVGETISFWFSTSTESCCDYLRFYIDGILVNSWSGTRAWQQYTRAVNPGSRVLKWVYTKDGSAVSGSDAVWIDDITLGSTLTEDLDDDGDGVLDVSDNCNLISNVDQLDSDSDGIGNVCDASPDFSDSDSDGVENVTDNCPLMANVDQENTDGDADGNVCDADDDNDGVADSGDLWPLDPSQSGDFDGDGYDALVDNCPAVSNSNQLDTDQDGQGDACDGDDDSDGVADASDAFPLNRAASLDFDRDGFPDDWNSNCDGQCQIEAGLAIDNCPGSINASQIDTDIDGMGDACDADDDNDGVNDALDVFPLDASEYRDNDGDGIGDNADDDDDNDGKLDGIDNCAMLWNQNQLDADNDGMGDACDGDDDGDGVSDVSDKFPLYAAASSDDDMDGYPSSWNASCDVACQLGSGLLLDNCPFNANPGQLNTDGDTKGNACDNDDDNDGTFDVADAFPLDPAESLDSDFDGVGNNTDFDDDNDGLLDGSDNCPLIANASQLDTDSDALGNVCDADDDNDGVADASDKFPLNAAASLDVDADGFADAWSATCNNTCQVDSGLVLDNCPTIQNINQLDTDGDLQGDACDVDDDGDGVSDVVDNCPILSNVDQLDSDDDGSGNVCDANPYQPIVVSWPTYQGNARHDGYVPVSVAVATASFNWQKLVGNGNALHPVTTASGKVFVMVYGYYNSPGLFVLNAQNGDTLWNKTYTAADGGNISRVNPPAYADNKVYVQTGNHSNDSFLWAYDADTGSQVFKSPYSAQWEQYYAPTIVDGTVYVNGGYYGGMYAFNGSTGTQLWFFSGLPQVDQWTPAVDAQHSYAYLGTGLYAINRITGVQDFKITDPESNSSQNSRPVLGGKNDAFGINNNRLIRFNLLDRSIDWQVSSNFTGQPVVAKGVVYAISNGQLAARDQLTGSLLWAATTPTNLQSPFIVTNTHIFASSSTATYAIDLQSRQSVWSYPKGGWLALGDNVLYIASSDGKLTSIYMPQDTDRDQVGDQTDNCLFDANTLQADIDGDGQGNVCDNDNDNDGVLDAAPDNCLLNPNADQLDTDSDSQGNVCDTDDDNDGVADSSDKFPLNAAAYLDADNDGVPDSWSASCDVACQADSGLVLDSCPILANADQANFDGDAHGDACDDDDNNNGVPDSSDICPREVPCAALADDYLDPGFGVNGRVLTETPAAAMIIYGAVQQANGKIVVAGTVQSSANNLDGVLMRYNTEGSLDTTFGVNGKAVTAFSSANDAFYAIAQQTDGKLVVAGSLCNWSDGATCLDENSALLRFTANGQLDSAFGAGGIVSLDTAGQAYVEQLHGVVVRDDGSIAAAGYTCSGFDGVNCIDWDTLLVRVDQNGALSSLTVLPVGAQNDQLYALAAQADGMLVAVGRTCASGVCDDYNSLIMRFNANGSLDTSFGINGSNHVSAGPNAWTEQLNSVAVQGDGKIVAAGYTCAVGGPGTCSDTDVLVMRFNTDGSLDGSFASGGIAPITLGSGNETAAAVVVRADGIWLGGSANDAFGLVHLTGSGALYSNFSGDGKHRSLALFHNAGHALLSQADGKLVLAGASHAVDADQAVLLRYIVPTDSDGDGVLDTEDAFPHDANESLDIDHDDVGNNADLDDDGDGVPDYIDAEPLNAATSNELLLPLNGTYKGSTIKDAVNVQ